MHKLALLCFLLAPVAAASAATPFDGTYAGTYAVNGGPHSERCTPGSFKITVSNGVFVWGGGNDPASIQVGPDGTFSGRSGRRFLTGKIADGKIAATVSTEYCNYTWSLAR